MGEVVHYVAKCGAEIYVGDHAYVMDIKDVHV